jgi:hypothetical protein
VGRGKEIPPSATGWGVERKRRSRHLNVQNDFLPPPPPPPPLSLPPYKASCGERHYIMYIVRSLFVLVIILVICC